MDRFRSWLRSVDLLHQRDCLLRESSRGSYADPTPGLRLIVGYQKGLHKIWTCVHGLAGWMMEKKAVTYTHEGLLDPIASFVLDANTGEELTTSP